MKASFKKYFRRADGTAFDFKACCARLAFAPLFFGVAMTTAVHAQGVVAPQNEDAPVAPAASPDTPVPVVAPPPASGRNLEIITTPRRSNRTTPPAPRMPARRPTLPVLPRQPRARSRVVTVVHRLSGWKMLNWLTTNGTRVVGVDEMPTARSVHTNIVAGYLSEDGRTVVVNLPQAEVEEQSPDMPTGMFGSTEETDSPNLMVVLSGGAKFNANFVGIDGVTGLSLLEVDGALSPEHGVSSPAPVAATPAVGQRVRLFAPEPTRQTDVAGDEGVVYAAMSEAEGRLAGIKRAPSGKPMQVVVKSEQLTPAWTGAVATNETGALVGIVAESGTGQTQLVPAEAVRGATARVLARRASVPQPWLGARGDAVAMLPLEKFLLNGWPRDAALELLNKRQGVLLSAIAPNSPAASAGLRPGDVIARISEREVQGVDDFSFFLNEAGSNSTVDFTVFRAMEESPLKMVVRLSESLNPATTMHAAEAGALAEVARTTVVQAQASLASALTAESEARALVQTARKTEADARARNDARLPELRNLLAGAQQNLERMQQIVRDARLRLDEAQARRVEAEKRLTLSREGFGARPFDFELVDGLEAIPISSKLAARFKARGGMLVLNVRPASAAARSGLQSGDVVEAINGQTLPEPDKAFEFFNLSNSELTLAIVRDGARLELKIAATLTEK